MEKSPSSSNYCNSPEFEFWRIRKPTSPQPHILSADDLFVDGVLLPLHLLSVQPKSDAPESDPSARDPDPELDPGPGLSPAVTASAASKRWRDIFKKTVETTNGLEEKEREKWKKKERKSNSISSSAELNINIWPFSRSKSAGNVVTRPGLFAGALGTRRVNSAPCSRSNSAGESKSGRSGIHLGRSSQVWQARRSKSPDPNAKNGSGREEHHASRRSKAGARVLKPHLSCRSDEDMAVCAGGSACVRGGNGGDNGSAGYGVHRFNLRSIFSKKSIVTSH